MSTPSRRRQLMRVYGDKTERKPTRRDRQFLNPKRKPTRRDRQFLDPRTYRVKLASKKSLFKKSLFKKSLFKKKRTKKRKKTRKNKKRTSKNKKRTSKNKKRKTRKRTKKGGFCFTKKCKRKERIDEENKKFNKDINQHKKETEQIKWDLVNELCTQTDKKEFEYCRNNILLPNYNRPLDKLLIDTNNMIKSPITSPITSPIPHKSIEAPIGLKNKRKINV